ncbi:endonuclease/exonuclease/phosphatase family protein [Sandaracinus amylolyticus]|uniref:Endonuclease/exonuclease/phosphatase n=1 Tax=Sandaracinus amylolyticus TaxID=927083 RepID=A0A0F6W998_9BACT|nr:endonuclease/exonuclease/phosphatase family protein [Sandaracinus amylolyticus]AKF10731.1 Endonuclease/exonuclease/phosphatase [Sandaracinus amylolyticus]
MTDADVELQAPPPTLRVMTYNTHGCVGTDGVRALERIADVLRACDADVIGLQEIDVGRTRSGGLDQAEAIAVRLGMSHVFGAALYDGRGHYGNAVLSRHPIEHVRTEKLPTWRAVSEPRCFVHTRVAAPGGELDVVVTHFGLGPIERMGQARHVAAEIERTSSPHTVLLGDFNCGRGSIAYRRLTTSLADAQQLGRPGYVCATYPSWRPILRIDHVLVGAGLEVLAAEVPNKGLVREASDHLPVVVSVRRARAVERARGRLA